MSDSLPLAAEFPATDVAEWRKLVDQALKGVSFEKRLVSQTYDGLRVEPLYSRAVGIQLVAGRAAGAAWTIMQRVDHPDPVAANKQALEDLENGATGLTLVFAGSIKANGYGLAATPETIARALDGVDLDAGITIDFNLSAATRNAVQMVVALVKERKLSPASVDLRTSLNPIGGFAAAGSSALPWSELSKTLASAIRGLADQGYRGPFAVADGRIIHNAGGSEAQELAFALSSAVDCLRALEVGGIPLDAARSMIYFRMSADADEFLTIAKFRAIRKLWARVEAACGLTPKPTTVAAETAWRMMTRRDPYVNMLRTTIAITAAGLGSADNILALPHTAALGLPDALARRIARNTQLVLLEESNLAKVADPAAGSGAIENLTGQLCTTAWALFQKMDEAGGAWASLEQGLIQREVAAVRVAREKAVARRKDALTGATDYPNLHERAAKVLDVAPLPKAKESPTTIEPLPSIRLAAPFEALRDKSDAMAQKTGARPNVFLATLGRLSDFSARAMYAKNFYETGGIEAITGDGYKYAAEMIAAFKKSGAKLACLCGSDTIYAEQATEAAKAITDAGAVVHFAGRPGELEAALKAAGVKAFIFVGCDVLSTLQATYDSLGSP
ncbi:MAG TPA: methylmalonyl-CoA mutase family protein [Pseudolabrys sp.]|nr:methylmalonyl-CoA mutase family protein [Pseudolabrys sp.]